MDLFVVNRFTGEDAEIEKSEEGNKLDEVLRKINRRKKRKTKSKIEVKSETIVDSLSELFKATLEDKNEAALVDNIEEEFSDDDQLTHAKKSKVVEPSNIEGFTILGTDKFDKRPTVKRVLPTWLRKPTVISTDLEKLSEKISRTDLNKKLKMRLKEKEMKYLFPVQAGFIPWQMRKSKQSNVIHPPDVCVSAPTGSGKTLAFALPLLNHLIDLLEDRNITVKAVRALLVLPTQSLALQIYNAFKYYAANTGITVGIITSSDTTFKNEQKLLVSNNSVWGASSRSDVLVCTAGRLIDHLKNTKGFDLKHLEYVIIDEADRVLDSMQDDWLRHLGMHLRSEGNSHHFVGSNVLTLSSIQKRSNPQKLLFSATLSSDPEKLEKLSLFQPKLFTCVSNNEIMENTEEIVGKYTMPNELIEKYVVCSASNKPQILYKLIMDTIKNKANAKMIVFVNETATGHRLSTLMCFMAKKNFSLKEISDKTPKTLRKELLESFSSGQTNVLICTNLIARGIDIPNVDCVLSYSTPTHIKTYVHRAGRTARGGIKGECITIVEPHEERKFLNMLESSSRCPEKLHCDDKDQEQDSLYQKALEQFTYKVNSQKRQTLFKTKIKKQVFQSVSVKKT